jgi:hypothetical protein
MLPTGDRIWQLIYPEYFFLNLPIIIKSCDLNTLWYYHQLFLQPARLRVSKITAISIYIGNFSPSFTWVQIQR